MHGTGKTCLIRNVITQFSDVINAVEVEKDNNNDNNNTNTNTTNNNNNNNTNNNNNANNNNNKNNNTNNNNNKKSHSPKTRKKMIQAYIDIKTMNPKCAGSLFEHIYFKLYDDMYGIHGSNNNNDSTTTKSTTKSNTKINTKSNTSTATAATADDDHGRMGVVQGGGCITGRSKTSIVANASTTVSGASSATVTATATANADDGVATADYINVPDDFDNNEYDDDDDNHDDDNHDFDEDEDFIEKQRKSGKQHKHKPKILHPQKIKKKTNTNTNTTTGTRKSKRIEMLHKYNLSSEGMYNNNGNNSIGNNDGGPTIKTKPQGNERRKKINKHYIHLTTLELGRALIQLLQGDSNPPPGQKATASASAFLILDSVELILSFGSATDGSGTGRNNFLSQILLIPKIMGINLTIIVITNEAFLDQSREFFIYKYSPFLLLLSLLGVY